MPTFVCSYAYDIACYADFVVEAQNEPAALRQIRKALAEGWFKDVTADPCWESGSRNERVFVMGPARDSSPTTTLAQLTGREHEFNIQTGKCTRCGRDAADEAKANTPCAPVAHSFTLKQKGKP